MFEGDYRGPIGGSAAGLEGLSYVGSGGGGGGRGDQRSSRDAMTPFEIAHFAALRQEAERRRQAQQVRWEQRWRWFVRLWRAAWDRR